MAAITTPSGMQAPNDATELTFNAGHPQAWELMAGGMQLATTAPPYVHWSQDPVGFSTWKKARSDKNLTSTPH